MKTADQGPCEAVTRVFTYGTLKRGQCRESCWPEDPTSISQAWVRGDLYGRHDYPALCRGGNRVLGEVWAFDSDQLSNVLAVLDQIEGTSQNSPSDLYHRHVVKAFVGEQTLSAFAYFYNRNPVEDGFCRVQVNSSEAQVWP